MPLDDLYLIVSFDCDTPQDALVVEEVHNRMVHRGVRPIYAVPGATLEEAPDAYRRLANKEAVFLNHGYSPHAYWDEHAARYLPRWFYDRLTREEIRSDVEAGHRVVERIVGKPPTGFRTPHFGTFQRRSDLLFLHSVLKQLRYEFSSSTVPLYGFWYGPLFTRFGLPEFPVTGTATRPMQILDSWSFFAAPERSFSEDDFLSQALAVGRMMKDAGPGILNIYADPSHIAEDDRFFSAVDAWCGVARAVSYSDLLTISAAT